MLLVIGYLLIIGYLSPFSRPLIPCLNPNLLVVYLVMWDQTGNSYMCWKYYFILHVNDDIWNISLSLIPVNWLGLHKQANVWRLWTLFIDLEMMSNCFF